VGLYDKYLLPRIVHLTCGLKPNMRQREKVVPLASGRVLEVGIGSGLNLPYYDPARVSSLLGLDPAPQMTRMARDAARSVDFEVEFINLSAEEMPLEDRTVDSIVITYTLCTIPNADIALGEMRRVLKPSGRLIFCEHGAAPDEDVRRWQDRVNPVWRRLAGGCHLNRAIPRLLEQGGFRLEVLDTMYLPGWRPASFNYWGSAVPAA